jgi:hypothetical protein
MDVSDRQMLGMGIGFADAAGEKGKEKYRLSLVTSAPPGRACCANKFALTAIEP